MSLRKNGYSVWLLALGLCGLLLSGCVSAPAKVEEEKVIRFPPPPDEPRFFFERTLLGSADVIAEDSATRWRKMLTGERSKTQAFLKPFDVAACKGNIYVSDSAYRRVLRFDIPQGKFSLIGDAEPGVLHKPMGINVDAHCRLYVVDIMQHRVMVYDAEGKFVTAFGNKDLFKRPSHVAINPEGTRAFVVDTGGVGTDQHHVRVFDIASGKHLYDISRRGPGEDELNLPRDLEVAPNGLVYVVDGGNFKVKAFTQEGEFVRSFGSVGMGLGQFSRPKGIASDAQSNIYVSDAAFGNVQVFNPEGKLLMLFGDRSAAGGPAMYMLPAGIDVDEDGRIYFVGQYFRKVDIFRPAELAKEAGYLGAWYQRSE